MGSLTRDRVIFWGHPEMLVLRPQLLNHESDSTATWLSQYLRIDAVTKCKGSRMDDQNSFRNVPNNIESLSKFGIFTFRPPTLANGPHLTSPIVFSCESTPSDTSSLVLPPFGPLRLYRKDARVSQVAGRSHSKVHFSRRDFFAISAVRIVSLRDLALNVSTHRGNDAQLSSLDQRSKLTSHGHET